MSDIDKQLDNFITRWCGENAAHLLDNDENDGQRLRDYIAQQVKEATVNGLIMAKYGTDEGSKEERFIDNLIRQEQK